MTTDTYRTQGLRKQMVKDLLTQGIQQEAVLKAMSEVPRHLFISKALIEHAYKDIPLPIDCQQTISQPYTVAAQTQLLEVSKNQRILEIGTGSGYQAAVLKKMGAAVYTIERHLSLYQAAKKRFEELKLAIASKYGDGYKGWAEFAPFNAILITCAVEEVPQNLLSQLAVGGVMVLPLGEPDKDQIMTKIIKISDNEFTTQSHGNYRFVPMLKATDTTKK